MKIKILSILILVLMLSSNGANAELAYKTKPACGEVYQKIASLVAGAKYQQALPIVLQEQSRYPLKKDADTSATNLCLETLAANLYKKNGDIPKAIGMLQAVLQNSKSELGESNSIAVYAEVSLSEAYIGTAQYNDAVLILEDAKNSVLRTQSKDHLDLIYTHLGEVYANLGDARKALEYDLAAYAEFKSNTAINSNKFREGIFLKNVAYDYNKLRNFAKGLSTIETSLQLMQESGAKEDSIEILDARLTWATALRETGSREKAIQINQDVYQITSNPRFPNKTFASKAQSDLAANTRDVDQNRAIAYQKDLYKKYADNNKLASPQALVNSFNLTQNLIASNQTDEALAYGNAMLKSLVDFRKKIADNDQLLSSWVRQSERTINMMINLNLTHNRFDALFLIEYFKSRSLSENFQLSTLEGKINNAEYKKFKNTKFQLTQVNQKIAVNQRLHIDAPDLNRAHAELGKTLLDYSLNHNFNDAIPTSKTPPDWYLAMNMLDPDAVKISYKFLGSSLWVFVYNGKGLYTKNLGNSTEIKTAINDYRVYTRNKVLSSNRTSNNDDQKTEQYLRILSDKLVAPIQERLGATGKLLVSPDAEIGGIAFDDLTINHKKMYQSFSVRMMPTFMIYNNLAEMRKQYANSDRNDFLGFGGISYESIMKYNNLISIQRERSHSMSQMDLAVISDQVKNNPELMPIAMLNYAGAFKNLPYSLETIEHIGQKFSRKNIYSDERASEASIYDLMTYGDLERYRIIHFAAHGYVNPYNPMLSAVVLAQTNRAPDTDGFLTASKIAGLSLHSDLVVLQSCDTAYGTYQSGDGVVGLTYSFFEAGSIGVISALWPIEVRKSGAFFEHFYDELKTSPASEALRRTKVWAADHNFSQDDISAYVYYGL